MAAVIFLFAAMVSWAQPDTDAIALHLRNWRTIGKFPALNKDPAAREALSHLHGHFGNWLDQRIKARRTVEEMNAELRAAGLLYREPDPNEPRDVDDGFTHYLGKIYPIEIKSHPDLLEVRAGIGVACGFSSSIALYDRATLARAGYIRDPIAPIDYSPLAIAPAFIGVFGQDSWCSSSLGAASITIYERTPGLLRPILTSARTFIRRTVDGAVTAGGDTVTFRYGGFSFDMGVMDRPAIERYRIANGKATRVAPLAESRLGVIEEWITLPSEAAAHFATPVAAAMHARDAKQWKEGYIYDRIERCGLHRWQIKIENGLHFILEGANSQTARIADVRRTPLPGCKPEKQDLLWAPF